MLWVAAAESRVLGSLYRTAMLRLAPVRRREGDVLGDLAAEAEALWSLADPALRRTRSAAIRRFHRRREALADALACLVAPTEDRIKRAIGE